MSISLAGCSVSGFKGDDSQYKNTKVVARSEPLKISIDPADMRSLARDGGEFSVQADGNSTSFAGLKTNQLFAEKIRDNHDRFDRLEDVVQDIRNEIDDVSPSINRLIAIEGDIQDLVTQLEVLLQDDVGASSAAEEAYDPYKIAASKGWKPSERDQSIKRSVVEIPPVVRAQQPQRTPHIGSPILSKVRMSDNVGTTRLVFESMGAMKYSSELDNGERLLMLYFEEGSIADAVGNTRMNSTLIKEIVPTEQGEGFILAVSLGTESRIIKRGVILPSEGHSYHRIWIDLAR